MMKPDQYTGYGLAREIRAARTHIPELMAEAANRLLEMDRLKQNKAQLDKERREALDMLLKLTRELHTLASGADVNMIPFADRLLDIETLAAFLYGETK